MYDLMSELREDGQVKPVMRKNISFFRIFHPEPDKWREKSPSEPEWDIEMVDEERLIEFISEHETELTYQKYPSETKFERASRHIQTGKKKGDWIWYMFPQAKGEVEHHKKNSMKPSPTSKKFAIQSMEEAVAFLENLTLGKNYLSLTALTAKQLKQGRSLIEIFENDANKVSCSLILFRRAALFAQYRDILSKGSFVRFIMDANSILSHAENEGIPSCEYASSFDNIKYSLKMGTLAPNVHDLTKNYWRYLEELQGEHTSVENSVEKKDSPASKGPMRPIGSASTDFGADLEDY